MPPSKRRSAVRRRQHQPARSVAAVLSGLAASVQALEKHGAALERELSALVAAHRARGASVLRY